MAHTHLTDSFGRKITYLRLAVTDRCNLRCFYCMPEEGINYLPKKELLTYEEMEQLVTIACSMGVNKVRITGGEPFVRKDMIMFLERLSKVEGLQELHITTNGTLTAPYVARLKALGITSVNLSLDTLSKERFFKITRRDQFEQVMSCLHQMQDANIPVKINMVVIEGKNTEDIIDMAELTKNAAISVRYIEEMPFNGTGAAYQSLLWNHDRILKKLRSRYEGMEKMKDPANSTAYHYSIPGHQGNIGIIAAYTRTFCGSCNRIRITSEGTLKTCLYDQGGHDIKRLLRANIPEEEIKTALAKAINSKHKDGWAAERARKEDVRESMSTIGG